MALPMKVMKAMKAMKAMKSMKVMKKAMKKTAMKKKAMKKSNVAKGKRAKSSVFKGTKAKTSSGLTKEGLMKNKRGKVVSKKKHAAALKSFKANGLAKWTAAVQQARKELGIKGFCAVGGKTAQGKALYAKAKSLLA
eukprot:TRINITY_DN1199_c0_g1_i2.p1 TRINITY_DN1199_c0_g1~~TRINITY_DN1199_c0_g1_i2.p1  ORF type:complete len:137 (-),score=49.89 TRINITY_DN1199_c0_g1_i2:386-796(-)